MLASSYHFPLIWQQLVDQYTYIWIFQNSVLAINFWRSWRDLAGYHDYRDSEAVKGCANRKMGLITVRKGRWRRVQHDRHPTMAKGGFGTKASFSYQQVLSFRGLLVLLKPPIWSCTCRQWLPAAVVEAGSEVLSFSVGLVPSWRWKSLGFEEVNDFTSWLFPVEGTCKRDDFSREIEG